jgi:hypothetical protein
LTIRRLPLDRLQHMLRPERADRNDHDPVRNLVIPWTPPSPYRRREKFGTVVRLVMKRASKTNSWDLATVEERMDYLRRCHWPTISRDFPPEFVQSEYCFKSIFRPWLGIEPTEEEEQAFLRKPVCSFAYSEERQPHKLC